MHIPWAGLAGLSGDGNTPSASAPRKRHGWSRVETRQGASDEPYRFALAPAPGSFTENLPSREGSRNAAQNAERRTGRAVDGAWTVDRGPSDSACVRLIVADPAQQQQRTHHRLTGHCTPGPGVRGKRVGRRRQARVLESCSSPPVQHDVRLAARPQHSHPRPHPHLPHGGCEARLTRRRAALHVSMWCIAV